MLSHYWLKMVPNYDTKMSRSELKEYKKINKFGKPDVDEKEKESEEESSVSQ